MTETVLVTGGTGFIAGHCIVQLLQSGFDVRASVRSLGKESALRASIVAAGASVERLTLVVADLTDDAGWDAAVAGCDYVLHVASPLGGASAADPDAMIAAARDGSLRVLLAAAKAGVKRVVMTSAAAAARPPPGSDAISTEAMWSDPNDPGFDSYRRSKVLAERAAWQFVAEHPGAIELTTVLPGAVFGPVLTRDNLGSVQIIQRLLEGRPPGLPRLGFSIVDVRDLAQLHVRAMLAPEAAGQRFLATGEFLWMKEVAAALRAGLGARASRVPTRALPDALVRMLAWFLPHLKLMTPLLGRKNAVSSQKARDLLGFAPRPATVTVVDCAKSLLT